MLSRLFAFLFKRRVRNRAAAERLDLQKLDAIAPLKEAAQAESADDVQAAERSVICREAVLDRHRHVVGYEFMLRGKAPDSMRPAGRRAHQRFYNEVMINHLLCDSVGKLLGQRQAFVTVIGSFLASPILNRLPGQGIVLAATFSGDTDDAPDRLSERIAELKRQGFQFALEECFDGVPFEALASHADYFIVRTSRHNPAAVQRIAENIRRHDQGAALIAKELESFDDFQFCNKLGFTLFQGPFVTRSEDWSDTQVGPQTLHVCDLLSHLRREADTAELTRLLKQDAVLSYRLLRYANSAAMGLPESVTSIEHALVLMGRQKMYRWLTLMLLGSAQNSPYTAALQENALVRGRFMELIGQGTFAEAERGSLFVTGLFSMLDLVLRMPLPTAIQSLHLPEAIEAAILRNEGPYAPFLKLALACEFADQDRIEAAAAECGVDIVTVNTQHFEALAWAQAIRF